MSWPHFTQRNRKAVDDRSPVSAEDQRLIAEAMAAGREDDERELISEDDGVVDAMTLGRAIR